MKTKQPSLGFKNGLWAPWPAGFVVFMACFGAAIGCVQRTMNDNERAADTQGLGAPQNLWPLAQVSVCFQTPTDTLRQRAARIAQVVTRAFNTQTVFRFQGMAPCQPGQNAQVIVHFVRANAHFRDNASIGRGLTKAQIFAQLESNSVGPRASVQLSDFYGLCSNDDVCLHNTSLHEFGHLVGLHHEHRRRLSTPGHQCRPSDGDAGVVPQGAMEMGPYDHESIMNYCLAGYFDTYKGLSTGDRRMIDSLYSREARRRR